MSESLKSAVRLAVLRLLDPLVRWMLEAGVGVGDFVSLVKLAYVRAARDQGRVSGGESNRPNASRISVVTGLTRVEVANILAADSAEPVHDRGRQRAERVLTGWWTDPSFQDTTTGGPAILPVRGGRRSFAALVDRYSGERWRIATILDELLRVKAVRRLSDGRLEALSRTYATVRWDPDGVIAFGEHVAELTATLLHNLKYPARARYVRRVVNARLDPRYVPMLRRDLELQAEALVDSQGDALNDSLHTLKGKRGEPEPASLGLTVYVFESQDDDMSAGTDVTTRAAGAKRRRPKR
jgi:hypothetical protein